MWEQVSRGLTGLKIRVKGGSLTFSVASPELSQRLPLSALFCCQSRRWRGSVLEYTLFLSRTHSRTTAAFSVFPVRSHHMKTDFRSYFVFCRHLLSSYWKCFTYITSFILDSNIRCILLPSSVYEWESPGFIASRLQHHDLKWIQAVCLQCTILPPCNCTWLFILRCLCRDVSNRYCQKSEGSDACRPK